MKKIKEFTLVFVLLISLIACNSDRLNIDVPESVSTIQFYRLDLDLMNCKTENDFEKLNAKYLKADADLYSFYTIACLQVGSPDDSSTLNHLKLFTEDEYMKKVNENLQQNFPTIPQKNEICQAFGYLNHYFPEKASPKNIFFYNSAFTNSVVSSPEAIGVGLERYLGPKNTIIAALSNQVFYEYIKTKMDATFLLRDVVFSWIDANYLTEEDENKLLVERIVNLGKAYYLTEAALPKLSKATLMRYSEKEFDWAEKNEYNFWKYLIEQNNLFKRDQETAMNIFNEAPFTAGLPTEEKSPARLGHYLGWKIVKAYMDEHPETSLQQLIKLNYKIVLNAYKTTN